MPGIAVPAGLIDGRASVPPANAGGGGVALVKVDSLSFVREPIELNDRGLSLRFAEDEDREVAKTDDGTTSNRRQSEINT